MYSGLGHLFLSCAGLKYGAGAVDTDVSGRVVKSVRGHNTDDRQNTGGVSELVALASMTETSRTMKTWPDMLQTARNGYHRSTGR